jgi:1-phosphofructokinase family hexose kinase
MKNNNVILTVGLAPAWDIVCHGDDLDWGRHSTVESTSFQPAGKALNISKALAWMGRTNIAAGLWGQDDYDQMLVSLQTLSKKIKVKLTTVPGGTRRNITIVDTKSGRDMHLRSRNELVSKEAIKRLDKDLAAIVRRGSVCVFAGAMPESRLLGDVVRIIKSCKNRGATVILDTSGPALKKIVDTGVVHLIKPNVEELCELLDRKITDRPDSLAKAARELLDKVEIVLISRGPKGAVVVTDKGSWQGRCLERVKAFSTVGCGDYLLAGFLDDFMKKNDFCRALEAAIKVATAKVSGCVNGETWTQIKRWIKVKVNSV